MEEAPQKLLDLRTELHQKMDELKAQQVECNGLLWHKTRFAVAEVVALFRPDDSVEPNDIERLCLNVTALCAASTAVTPLLQAQVIGRWTCLRRALLTRPEEVWEPNMCNEACQDVCVEWLKAPDNLFQKAIYLVRKHQRGNIAAKVEEI